MDENIDEIIEIQDDERTHSDAELDELLGIEHATGGEDFDEDDPEEGDFPDDEETAEKKPSFKKRDKKPKKKQVKADYEQPEEPVEAPQDNKAAFKSEHILVHRREEETEEAIERPEADHVRYADYKSEGVRHYEAASDPKVAQSHAEGKPEQTIHETVRREEQPQTPKDTGGSHVTQSPGQVQPPGRDTEALLEVLRNSPDAGAKTGAGTPELQPIDFDGKHAYEEYSEQMGELAVHAARTEDDSTLSQGIKEFRSSEMVYVAKALSQETGTASLYKEMRVADERLEAACKDAASLIKEGKISLADLDSKEAFTRKLSGTAVSEKTETAAASVKEICKYREDIVKKFTIRSELLSKKGVLTKAESEWIASDRFYRSASSPRFGRILEKYFATETVPFSKDVKLTNLRYEDVKKLSKKYEKRGFSREVHKDLLKDYEKRLRKRELRLRVYGRGMVSKKPIRLATHFTTAAMSSNRDVGHFIHKSRVYLTSAQIAKRAFFLSGSYLKKHSLIGKATSKAGAFVKKKTAEAISKTKMAKAVKSAKNTLGYTARQTYKYAVNKTKEVLKVKSFEKKVQRAKATVYNTKPVKFARKASGRVKAGAKAVKTKTQKISHVLSTPIRALGKITDFMRKVNLKVLGVIGGALLALFKLYNILLFLVMLLLSIDSLLARAENTGHQMVSSYIDMVRSVINYEDYSDMRSDIEYMRERDRERAQRAREIGEGEPIDPEITNGYTIDRYGSHDNPKGYTITVTDPHGIELPEDTSNARDIEALCIAMISNDLGMYKGYSRDKRMLDDLIADMYDLLAEDLTVEESDIYFCSGGCRLFYYHCNSWDDYNFYYELYANGATCYTELVPLLSEDDGCETYMRYDWDVHDYVEDYYCPGEHTARVCLGHKDANINIRLYGLEYAISHNMYPSDWRSKSYAPMIKEFVERGAWTNPLFAEYARRYYSGDWSELYGIDLEGGVGFASADPLTDAEIEEIMALLPEDISAARRDIVEFALGAVGRVGYQWGGKASGVGWGASFGSSTPDEKGRTNGLDCSGFVQWVYRSAIGRNIPGSTAGYSGYARIDKTSLEVGDLGFYNIPGSEGNHIGIYVGKDSFGNDTWVHCAGSTGSIYGSGNFKYFVKILN